MARRLYYVDADFAGVSSVTRAKRIGVGTSAPSDAARAVGYFQNVPKNSTAGTEYSFSFYNYIRPLAPAATTDYRNIYAISQTAGGTNQEIRDVISTYSYALNNSAGIARNVYAIYGNAAANGVGSFTTSVFGGYFYGNSNKTCTNIHGSYSYAYAQINGTVTNIYGSRILSYNYTGSTTTRQYGEYINLRVQNAGTVSTNSYGMYISGTAIAPATFTNFYSLFIATPPAVTGTAYCIYSSGDVKSYHRGPLGLGLGATNVGTDQLRVVGTAGLSTGTTWTVFSDARLKDVINKYDKGLNEITKLKPVVYKYKKDNDLNLDNKLRSGLIAQEVQDVFPDAINSDGEYLKLNVDPINYAIINAIKELNDKIKLLETENKELKKCLLQ